NNSGLTATSRISPRQMVEILKFANASLASDRAFASLLPISGWKGTLSNRFAGPNAILRVWAKTGTILYGKALAGYLFTPQNRRLAFTIFASDFERRKAFDANMDKHTQEEISEGKSWNSQASGHISALVEKWLQTY
ncbi:MAG: D-alanyl-D-alanine carboxypeptidase, partial [Magnetococcales bacterium]|nr:D-alanyl-D-alanine carboxypeptidase [Magnetococcales bacterium]